MTKHKEEAIDRSVAAVERTASILNAFLLERRPLSLGELEAATGLFKSVILRYMITLVRENVIRKLDNGSYHLGTKVLSLANVYEQSIDNSSLIMDSVERLSKCTQETASFYVREGATRVCLFRKNSPRSLLVNVRPGDTKPLDDTSTGQVLREAEANPTRNEDYVRQSTAQTDSLTGSISAPVFDARERLVGALTLSGPIGRFDTSDPLIRDALLDEVKRLSAALGSIQRFAAPPDTAEHRPKSAARSIQATKKRSVRRAKAS